MENELHPFTGMKHTKQDSSQERIFNPKRNPYVSMIQDHKDIIYTYPTVTQPTTIEFANPELPVIVDIGCGAGNFLRDYALQNPNINFVGIELRYKRLVKGALKFKKHNIQNVRLIQARAEEIDKWFKPGSLKEIHINFPDPWPKKRQQKHRYITQIYLHTLASLLRNKGHFVFKTDHWDYFLSVTNMIRQSQFFEILDYSEDLHQSEHAEKNIQTEFEQLFKNKAIPVFFLRSVTRSL